MINPSNVNKALQANQESEKSENFPKMEVDWSKHGETGPQFASEETFDDMVTSEDPHGFNGDAFFFLEKENGNIEEDTEANRSKITLKKPKDSKRRRRKSKGSSKGGSGRSASTPARATSNGNLGGFEESWEQSTSSLSIDPFWSSESFAADAASRGEHSKSDGKKHFHAWEGSEMGPGPPADIINSWGAWHDDEGNVVQEAVDLGSTPKTHHLPSRPSLSKREDAGRHQKPSSSQNAAFTERIKKKTVLLDVSLLTSHASKEARYRNFDEHSVHTSASMFQRVSSTPAADDERTWTPGMSPRNSRSKRESGSSTRGERTFSKFKFRSPRPLGDRPRTTYSSSRYSAVASASCLPLIPNSADSVDQDDYNQAFEVASPLESFVKGAADSSFVGASAFPMLSEDFDEAQMKGLPRQPNRSLSLPLDVSVTPLLPSSPNGGNKHASCGNVGRAGERNSPKSRANSGNARWNGNAKESPGSNKVPSQSSRIGIRRSATALPKLFRGLNTSSTHSGHQLLATGQSSRSMSSSCSSESGFTPLVEPTITTTKKKKKKKSEDSSRPVAAQLVMPQSERGSLKVLQVQF